MLKSVLLGSHIFVMGRSAFSKAWIQKFNLDGAPVAHASTTGITGAVRVASLSVTSNNLILFKGYSTGLKADYESTMVINADTFLETGFSFMSTVEGQIDFSYSDYFSIDDERDLVCAALVKESRLH